MKSWKWISLATLIVLWAAGGWWYYLPHVEKQLQSAAQAALADPQHRGAFDEVKVEFSGQSALLTGTVADDAAKDKARAIVQNDLHADAPFASSLNPVLDVTNRINVDGSLRTKHPEPWLLALVMPGKSTIAGVLPAQADTDSAVKALTAKLPPAPSTLENKITTNTGGRSAIDLPRTLASIPDLPAAALNDPNHIVLAATACDGHWSNVLPGKTADVNAIAVAISSAHPDINTIATALAGLTQWQDAELEKERIARLPAAALGAVAFGDTVHLLGTLGDEDSRKKLLAAIATAYPKLKPADATTISDAVKPAADFTKALAAAPKTVDANGTVFALAADGKAITWDGKGALEEMKKVFASLPGVPAEALWAKLDLVRKSKAEDDARKKAEADAKAKAEAEAKAKAEADAKARAEAEAKAKMAAASPAAPKDAPATQPAAASGYIGWTVHNGQVSLFGVVADDAQRQAAVKAALAAFPNAKLDFDHIRLDPARALTAVKFPEKLDTSAPMLGIVTADGTGHPMSVDAFDSEIAKEFPSVPFAEGELSAALAGFRASLIKAGKLTLNDPYLALISDGKQISVVGEVSDAATKKQIMDAIIKGTATGLTVADRLTTSGLVTSVKGDLKATLASLPKFEPGKPGIATTQPGQTFRTGVVHAVYFRTGSDRSVDQERALAQVRRVIAANPQAKFEIVGNTDNVGVADKNQALSQQRAENMLDYLAAGGIDKTRLSARGAGSTNPIADNATDAGKALNRRVDIVLK